MFRILLLLFCLLNDAVAQDREPIRVGILHSQSGPLAINERPLIATLRLALRTLNEQDPLLGRYIQPIVRDGASDPLVFAEQARRLIVEDKVAVIFGCFSSATRKQVAPVLEELNGLLFYSIAFEGLEDHPNILYLGGTPNLRTIPTLRYFVLHYGPRIFFVGTDYIYTHAEHEIINDHFKGWGGELVDSAYIPIGSDDFDEVMAKIKASKPDVIINSIRGSSIKPFFEAYQQAGYTADTLPIISTNFGEPEVRHIGVDLTRGQYSIVSWLRCIDTRTSTQFKSFFTDDEPISDTMASTWFAVSLWADAVRRTQNIDPQQILEVIKGKSYLSPTGMTYFDPETNYSWIPSYIGRINPQGQLDFVWSSRHPHPPDPFPKTRSQESWQSFLDGLYKSWGNSWQNKSALQPK